METWIALIGFSFASSVTPGPNNILLWASGASFGLRRTLPHVAGTALGIGAMALLVTAGSSVVAGAIPGLATLMKVGGSAYLLYLAVRVARSGTLQRGESARPLGLLGAAGFQALNPKAWILAVGAVATFRSPELPALLGGVVVALTMTVVIVPTAVLWASAGGALERLANRPDAQRAVGLGLAALLVATIVLVWI
ncbi:MAG TPA: LysE family translocator [Patescibacteria group bacterium]|nr:LysE family translocator [Patescibacteria group bacterium]